MKILDFFRKSILLKISFLIASFLTGSLYAAQNEQNLEKAFQALMVDKPLEALELLEKLNPETPDVIAAKLFAAFELNSWKETIELYEKLPASYKSLEEFQGIVIEANLALGNSSEAEKILDNLLKRPKKSEPENYPAYFQNFKKQKLAVWNRFYIAAHYYKIVKRDLSKALFYLKKIDPPTNASKIEIAKIYRLMGNFQESINLLRELLNNSKNQENEKEIKRQILPLLADSSRNIGEYAQAVSYFQEYYSLNPDDEMLRVFYASALMKLKRYDLALAQFQKYKLQANFTSRDQLNVMECLIHTDQFEAANKLADDWMAQNEVTLFYKIKIAQLLTITKYTSFIETIFQEIAEKEVRTKEENQELIRLQIDLGRLDEALALANTIQRTLETSQGGLLVLAELYSHLSNEEEAYKFTEMAFQLNPSNLEVKSLLQKYEKNDSWLVKQAKNLKEKLNKDPKNPSLILEYTKNLIEIAIESYSKGEIKQFSLSSDLNTAKSLIEELTNKNEDIPESYFLQGKIWYLLDENHKASLSYQKALKLDVSYIEAYQYLALAEEELQNQNEALIALSTAAKFDPSNAKIWLQMADLLFKGNQFLLSIKALENAIKYAPNNLNGYFKLAQNSLKIEKPSEAISNLDKVLELAPNQIPAIKLMLIALYDKKYEETILDKDELNKRRFKYWDKLQALAPKEAENLRKQLLKNSFPPSVKEKVATIKETTMPPVERAIP